MRDLFRYLLGLRDLQDRPIAGSRPQPTTAEVIDSLGVAVLGQLIQDPERSVLGSSDEAAQSQQTHHAQQFHGLFSIERD
jgi:hypothetical protein